MPSKTFNDDTMNVMNTAGNYQFSAVKLDNLGATEYSLVTIVQDNTGSVQAFKNDMEKCIQTAVEACQKSPRAENLMLRLVKFNTKIEEVHGFKLLGSINIKDYDGVLNPDGMTALYDAVYTSIEATKDYGKVLTGQDFLANAIVFIITDGVNNAGTYTTASIKKLVASVIKEECLESIVVVLVGVGTKADPNVSPYLEDFKKEAGITQYVEIEDTSTKKLAKLASFISRSVSSTSQSLGSGSASQLLTV